MNLKGIFNIYFLNYKFNNKQLTELKLGKSHKVDYFIYAKPELHYLQMQLVRLALEKGLDTTVLINSKFNPRQIAEIHLG